MVLDAILIEALKRKASDIHLKVGSPPMVRISRSIQPLNNHILTNEEILTFVKQVTKTKQKLEELVKKGELDISYSIPKVSRFRVNIYRQRGSYAFAFRVLKNKIPTIEELNLPPKLKEIAMEPRGLVLVTGPTGSGKSTTLASMIDYRNENGKDVIITIEDPIEYIYKDKRCYIVQREIGMDTLSFSSALRAALREDPDVILVGEMRDLETIEIALRAAETGHLVFSTLHTLDAKDTVTRIVDMFPAEEQNHIRILLANTLKAVISQRLIPRKDGKGVVPAIEILINVGAIYDALLDPDKIGDIPELMEKGKKSYGTQTFDQSIYDLYSKGLITLKDALTYATNPSDLELKIKGISTETEFDDDMFGGGAFGAH